MSQPDPISPRRAARLRAFVCRHRVVLLVTFLWSLSLHWWDPELLWHSHSPAFEPIRSMGVVHAWKQGIWDARWLPLFDKGYGYPIFSYHSPLFSLLTAAFMVIVQLPALAMKLAILLFFVVGGLGCRALAARYWAPRDGRDDEAGDIAFVGWGSVTYLFTNVFVRGSFAEFAASCFFPWVLLGMWLVSRGGRRSVRGALVLAAALSLLVLSHNAIAAYVALIALPMCALLPPKGLRGWLAGAAGGVAALGMTAFFAVAAAVEKPFVRLDAVTDVDFHDHFVRLDHLFAVGTWNVGVSGQSDGCTMPRHLGLLLPFALLAALLAYRLTEHPRLRRKLVVAAALAALPLFMATRASVWIWELVGMLRYTQFPWRWLSLTAAPLALVLPALGVVLRQRGEETLRQAFLVGVAAVLLVNVGAYGGPNHGWTTWRFETDDAHIVIHDERTTLGDEYGPIWRPTRLTHPISSGALSAPGISIEAPASVSGATWTWELPARPGEQRTVVGLNYFPAWTARWRDAGGAVIPLPVLDDAGLVQVNVPAGGAGRLELHFANTPLRLRLKLLAAAVLAVFLVVLGLHLRPTRALPLDVAPPDVAPPEGGPERGPGEPPPGEVAPAPDEAPPAPDVAAV